MLHTQFLFTRVAATSLLQASQDCPFSNCPASNISIFSLVSRPQAKPPRPFLATTR